MALTTKVKIAISRPAKWSWYKINEFTVSASQFQSSLLTVEVVEKNLMKPKEMDWNYKIRLESNLVQLFIQTPNHMGGPVMPSAHPRAGLILFFKHPPLTDFPDILIFCSHYMVCFSPPSFHFRVLLSVKDDLTSPGTPETKGTLFYNETSTNSGLCIHYLKFSQALYW